MAKIKLTKPPPPRPRRGARARVGSGASDRWLYGQHPVLAALNNPARAVQRLLATKQAAARLHRDCPAAMPEIVDRSALESRLPPGAVHQGLALLAAPLEQPALEAAVQGAPETAVMVVLDRVTDPQNVGAILRSAAAFGATALILPQRHAPPLTGVLAKAASGALEWVPVISVTNLAQALETLKQSGFWCLGLDADADASIEDSRMDGRVALVLGAEGAGLRRLTAERCDLLMRLPTEGKLTTLNVSNAAAVALYALTRRADP